MTTLEDLASPRSIAIIGASDDPTRIGGRPLSQMIAQRYDGTVFAVNPTRETVQGLPAYASLTDIPQDVDFVLIAVPAPLVAEQVRIAATKNAKTALVFSSGFAETGAEGIALQDDLTAAARETGIRVIGPNCLGLFNTGQRFFPTFSSVIDRAMPKPGGVGIVSQSGAYGSHIYMASHLRGLGIGYWITTGNEADVSAAEVIGLMAQRDDVHTILAYAESIRNGEHLIEALETARANRKPVVFMKVGRSEVGAAAAASHTASLAGEDAIYDAVLRQHGAWRVRSTEEMIDVAIAARPRIYPAGRKLGLVTISGGAGVLMADAAEDAGLDVPEMPKSAQTEITTILPFAAPRNPVDVTAHFINDLSLIPRFTRILLDAGGYDGVIGFWTYVGGSPVLAAPLLDYLTETMKDYPDRLFLHVLLAPEEVTQRYDEAGFPTFEDPTRAVRAMAALMAFGTAFAKERASPPDVPGPSDFGEIPVGEERAKLVLKAFGLPFNSGRLAASADEAGRITEEFGCPVALKIASPDIAHKTEVGGVKLDIRDSATAGAVYQTMTDSTRRTMPDARIDGVLVSPMIENGIDCILGAKIDPAFGPVVMFGLGGVFAETIKNVAFRRAPFGVEIAHEMIRELTGAPVLMGLRGQPAADLDALAQAISGMSIFAAANADRIESAEINPLRALPDGCIGLDALIIRNGDA